MQMTVLFDTGLLGYVNGETAASVSKNETQAHFIGTCFYAVSNDPASISEAKKRPEWPQWEAAALTEIE